MTETPKPCACPDDANTFVDGIVITGHTNGCIHGEPRRYVWLSGGDLRVGILADYAKAVDHADMAGVIEEISTELRTWDEKFIAEFSGGDKFDEDDYATRTITVGNESAVYTIDGRA